MVELRLSKPVVAGSSPVVRLYFSLFCLLLIWHILNSGDDVTDIVEVLLGGRRDIVSFVNSGDRRTFEGYFKKIEDNKVVVTQRREEATVFNSLWNKPRFWSKINECLMSDPRQRHLYPCHAVYMGGYKFEFIKEIVDYAIGNKYKNVHHLSMQSSAFGEMSWRGYLEFKKVFYEFTVNLYIKGDTTSVEMGVNTYNSLRGQAKRHLYGYNVTTYSFYPGDKIPTSDFVYFITELWEIGLKGVELHKETGQTVAQNTWSVAFSAKVGDVEYTASGIDGDSDLILQGAPTPIDHFIINKLLEIEHYSR